MVGLFHSRFRSMKCVLTSCDSPVGSCLRRMKGRRKVDYSRNVMTLVSELTLFIDIHPCHDLIPHLVYCSPEHTPFFPFSGFDLFHDLDDHRLCFYARCVPRILRIVYLLSNLESARCLAVTLARGRRGANGQGHQAACHIRTGE